jgi:hypothetical protein
MHDTPLEHCLKCNQRLEHGPFCPRCGQRNVHQRLQLWDLFTDIREHILEWDAPWLFTIKELTIRPGLTCKNYIEGKRERYVNPLRYALYISAIVLIIAQILPYDILGFGEPDGRYEQFNGVQRFIWANPMALYIPISPIIVYFYRLLFFRTELNKTEISCLALYIIGHSILLLLLLSILGYVISYLVYTRLDESFFLFFQLISFVLFMPAYATLPALASLRRVSLQYW